MRLHEATHRRTYGESETKTKQIEYADPARDVEDQRTVAVHLSAVPPAAPPALRVPELRSLQRSHAIAQEDEAKPAG